MFKIIHEDNKARLGRLKTSHGIIETPFFMPVATKATPKLLSFHDLKEIGFKAFISNAFLIYLKPGLELIESVGSLHKFINWNNIIFTDSGGFQILKDSLFINSTEKGVYFKNPFTNKKELFTPEKSISIQNVLDSDVIMCFDFVPKANSVETILRKSIELTTQWAEKCQSIHSNKKQLLFGITQGGVNKKLRKKSTLDLLKLDFQGYSIGGLCIGEQKNKTLEMIELSKQLIPNEKPVYLMGLGSPIELLEAIALGIDIFDSAYPTMLARHGHAFTSKGLLKLENSKFKKDFTKLDSECNCFTCNNTSKAFLHHLIKSNELSYKVLLSYHNLYFLFELMEKAKQAIKLNSFSEFKNQFIKKYKSF